MTEIEAQKTAWKIKWDDLTFSSTKSLAKSYATMSLSESTPYLQSRASRSSDKSYVSTNLKFQRIVFEAECVHCKLQEYSHFLVIVTLMLRQYDQL